MPEQTMVLSKEISQETVDVRRGLSAFWYKFIAVLTMLIDHASFVLLPLLIAWNFLDYTQFLDYYYLGRSIGRLSMPFFVFFVMEGYLHTRSKSRYILRMLLFGILSEPFFDQAFLQSWFDMTDQNVMFSFALALLALYTVEKLTKRLKGNAYFTAGLSLFIYLAFALLASFFSVDYDYYPVITLAFMYHFQEHRKILLPSLTFLILGVLRGDFGLFTFVYFIVSLVVAFLLYFYNGKRGPNFKYFFYLFYPLHLLVLVILRSYLSPF